jgi:hypothetical protein
VRTRETLSAIALIGSALLGCAEPAPSEACLGDEPVTVTLPFARLENIFHEAQPDLELVRFVFDRSVAGSVSATAEPAAPGHYVEAQTDVPVAPLGERLTSIRLDGLIGGAATDRVRADGGQPFAIRDIMQVKDPAGFRWIVGTTAGTCARLRANPDAGVIVLAVTAS